MCLELLALLHESGSNLQSIVETTDAPDAPDDPSHFHVGRHLSVRRVKISATGCAAGITGARPERRGRGGPRPLQSSRGFAPPRRFGGRDGYPHAGANGAAPGRSRARAPGDPFGISDSPIFGPSSKSSQCSFGGGTFGIKFGNTIFQRPTFGSGSGSSDQVRFP